MENLECNHPLWEFGSEMVTNAKGEIQPKVKAKYIGPEADPLVVVQKSQLMFDEQNKYIDSLRNQ